MDILSLSDLDLRKAVAKAQGYEVKESHVCTFANFSGLNRRAAYRYSLQKDGKEVAFSLVSEENVLPPLDLAHTFPLVLEMNEMGIVIDLYALPPDQSEIRFVVWYNGLGKTGYVYSDSNTDPSDAIAKCYLLVRKEMGM